MKIGLTYFQLEIVVTGDGSGGGGGALVVGGAIQTSSVEVRGR
jgi:hypothetical protein